MAKTKESETKEALKKATGTKKTATKSTVTKPASSKASTKATSTKKTATKSTVTKPASSKTSTKATGTKKTATKSTVTKPASSKASTKATGTKKTATKSTATKPVSTKTSAKVASTKKTSAKTTATKQTSAKTQVSEKVSSITLEQEIEQNNREISALLQNNLFDSETFGTTNSNSVITNSAESNYEKTFFDKVKESLKNKKVLIVIIAVLILIFLFFFLRSCSSTSNDSALKKRQNTILLAQKYIEKGQFDPAMELLNKLLIENADDKEVNDLLDKLIELKALEDAKNGANFATSNSYSPGGSYDINIDTDGIRDAFRDSLDSMSRELSAANEANAKNQETINRLLEAQRLQEQEKASQAKALEAQKKAEEAERKAKEEELAKQNKKNAEKIAKINDLINQGNANLNTGKSGDALKKYEEAVKFLPIDQGEPSFSSSKYAEIASNLYDAAEREKNPETKSTLMNNAVKYAQKAIEKDPSNAKAHFILAMNAENNKDAVTAEKELELAVKNDPNNYLYYYYLGRRQFINKKYQQARSSFTSSIKLNNQFDSSHYNLGVTCVRLNLSKEALSSFRKAYGVNPQHSKAYLEEARLLSRVYKDYNGAIIAYNKVLSIEPDNMAALRECGGVYANIEKYSEAENCFRKVVAMLGSKKDPMTFYNLSTVLFNQGKVEDAKKYALEAYNSKDDLRTSKDKANVVYNYALVLENVKETDQAILLYKEALSLNPSHTKAKTNLGIMFMEMNPPDVDTALAFLTQAYSEDKNNFEINNNLGNAYLLKKDYTNAIDYYLNATKLKSKDVQVKENLAKAYAEASQFDNAKEIYERVIELNPNSYDSYIELAKVCIALKDTVKAEGYLQALQVKRPEYRVSEVKSLLDAIKQ